MLSALKAFALAASVLAPFVSAAPLGRRTASAGDITVLQFAFTLEGLEAEFYKRALEKFGEAELLAAGYVNAGIAAEQLQTISRDESAHLSALEVALRAFGQEPIKCQFSLDAVLTDVATTMPVARLVEDVGVSAYSGAARIMDDPRLLTIAASILPIESRHQSLLNILNGGTASPQAFDIPLNPEEVLAMAGPFITGCDLGVKANPSLTINADGPIGPGTKLSFKADGIDAAAGQKLFCQMLVGGATTALPLAIDNCVVPPNIDGPVAIWVTNSEQPLHGIDTISRQGQASTVVAGPNYIFVDFGHPAQAIAQAVLKPDSPLAKDLKGAAPASSETTSTILPSEASSSVSEAEASSTGSVEASSTGSVESTPAATDSAPVEPTPAAGGAAAGPASKLPTTFLGDISVKMPTPAAQPAAAATETPGTAGQLPINVGASPSTESGSAGAPAPTPEPAAGGAAPSGGDIVPIVPGAAGGITPVVPSSD